MNLIPQSFLPVVNASTNEVLGLVSIPQNTFLGTETSYSLGGFSFPLKIITMFNTNLERPLISYMSVSMSDYECRTGQFLSVPGILEISLFIQQEYVITISGFSGNILPLNQTQLLTILMTGAMRIVSSVVTLVSIVPTSPRTWNLTAELSTSSACTFFDIPFTDSSLYVAGVPALSISLSTPMPSGVVENFLKIYTFQDPGQPMTPGGMSNVIRFIKLNAGVIPPGVYTYQVTATLQGVTSELTTLNLNIV